MAAPRILLFYRHMESGKRHNLCMLCRNSHRRQSVHQTRPQAPPQRRNPRLQLPGMVLGGPWSGFRRRNRHRDLPDQLDRGVQVYRRELPRKHFRRRGREAAREDLFR